MIKYIHTFKVSSGKGQKKIGKVYEDLETAKEQHKLLGGKLEMVEVLQERGKV